MWVVNPYVKNTRADGASGGGFIYTGALAGRSEGGTTVRGSYVSGGSLESNRETIPGNNYVYSGCLLGASRGAVSASWASCDANHRDDLYHL